MKIYKNITELIGKTPMIRLNTFSEETGTNLIAKLERTNPGGSAKDRVALSMIEDAEKRGILKEGGTIIEPTSGNTGIGLAAVGTAKGYKAVIVMPDTMSSERISLIKAFGAEVILTDGAEGMAGSIRKAEELKNEIKDSWIAGQFDNPANAEAHYRTTGPEIWEDTEGKIDIFVASIGTGGTITGVGRFLKEKNPDIKIIGVEPSASPLISQGHAGPHKIQGIGANFIPAVLDRGLIDEMVCVTNENAYETADMLAKREGLLCGISSGAVLAAACEVARREESRGKNIVMVLTDTGERYLSTGVFK